MIVSYHSNNSGGGWWLKDGDWAALELAGWTVEWEKDNNKRGDIFGPNVDGRWLGSLASHASKDFPTIPAAIAEWERITGQCATDEGCNCCGPPHDFYATGEDGEEISYVIPERPGRYPRNDEEEPEPEECRCGNCEDILNAEGRCPLCAYRAAMED
jgi:hypothetical protein